MRKMLSKRLGSSDSLSVFLTMKLITLTQTALARGEAASRVMSVASQFTSCNFRYYKSQGVVW